MVLQFSGRLLRSIRTSQHLSREQLAVRGRVSMSAVSRYEQGHAVPGLNAAAALADALGVEITDLMAGHAEATAGES